VSETRPRGEDGLDRLAAWGRVKAPRRALNLKGDGDTALAVTTGGSPGIVRVVGGDAGGLPFDNGVFDLVTCRLAAHRFPHVALAVREIQRVLASGGSFLLEEPLGDDEADPAPPGAAAVRAYRRREWHAFLRAAGLTVMEEDTLAGDGSPATRSIRIRAEKD
jgi:SAM-dependent methyltransferase